MDEDDFEWDPVKAQRNLLKHEIGFAAARLVFDDIFVLDRIETSTDYGEDRFSLIGLVNDVVLTVIYTERESRTRIASVRKATKHEEREYRHSKALG